MRARLSARNEDEFRGPGRQFQPSGQPQRFGASGSHETPSLPFSPFCGTRVRLCEPGALGFGAPLPLVPLPPKKPASNSHQAMAAIPGPLRSFLRMAAISQKISPDEVLPLLSRNIFLIGYTGSGGRGQPTEFLLLLRRYVQQARELEDLAGSDGVIRVTGCDDAKRLLQVLGYRTGADCGKSVTFLQTEDPQRAFLTTDSGFPLSELRENAIGWNAVCVRVPDLPRARAARGTGLDDGAENGDSGKGTRDLLDALLHDPVLAHLYYAWAHLDPETRVALHRSPGLKKLEPLVGSLDFYGGYLLVRKGHVVVPGGSGAESAWKDLVGANPQSPAEFLPQLLSRDNGWLAAYFDSLSRIPRKSKRILLNRGGCDVATRPFAEKRLPPAPWRQSFALTRTSCC